MQAAEGGVGGGGPHVHSSGDRVGSRGGVGGVGASAHGNGVPVGEDGNILETGGGGGGGGLHNTLTAAHLDTWQWLKWQRLRYEYLTTI